MSNDDPFNDSDEVFSLYSSKNITETFKAQLKKIVANSNHSKQAVSQVNNEKTSPEVDKTNLEENSKLNKNIEEVNFVKENTPEKVEDDSFIEIIEERSFDDPIEVISEIRSPNSNRWRGRLRKKRGANNSGLRSGKDVAVPKASTRGRKSSAGKRKQKQKQGDIIDEITLEDSPQPTDNEDELNPEISVKVIWKSVSVKKFNIRKFQKLAMIYELLSKEEGIPEDKIILTFNNVKVNRNETPDSLNLQVYHFLDGGALSEASAVQQTSNSSSTKADKDLITLKFQDVNKKTISVSINKNEKLKLGMIKCSEQLDIPLHKIKFYFDGDLLQSSGTPELLGLENGEVIDIKIIK